MHSGLKRLTLKVRVARPLGNGRDQPWSPAGGIDDPAEMVESDGMPNSFVMKHLLDLFVQHFGCQYPSIDRERLEADIEGRTGSVFLLNCIAATASR